MEQSEYVKEPQNDANDHDCVQDGLDAACHGDETIHEPKQDAHYDQGYKNLNERHTFRPFCLCCETLPRRSQGLLFTLPGAEIASNPFHSTNDWASNQTSGANDVLFDVLSSFGGRGVQAEGDELANTTVPLPQDNLRSCQGACLFTCIQIRS